MFNPIIVETVFCATRKLFLKLLKLFELCIVVICRLYPAKIIEEGKKVVFEVKTILWCVSRFDGVVTHRDIAEIDFSRSCSKCTVCETNAFVEETLNRISDKVFLSNYFLLRLLLPTKHYIESILSYLGMEYCTLDQS